MTERLGRMLDEVAQGVRPRERDPVPAIARRVRRHRRRAVAAVCAAVAVLVGVGGAAAVELTRGAGGGPDTPAATPKPTASPVTTPATPVVANGTVRAGGFRMPVPDGWTVVTGDQPICATAPRTLFLEGTATPGGPCTDSPTRVSIRGYSLAGHHDLLMSPERQMILPGGQPAWLQVAAQGALVDGPGTEPTTVTALLPWAGVTIAMTGERSLSRTLFASIRTEPVAADRLVLPDRSRTLALAEESRRKGRAVTDPAAVDTVYRALARLTRPVTPEETCPPDTPMTTVEILDGGAFGAIAAVLVLGRHPSCDQVTSSLGGRVWLTPEARAALIPYIPGGGTR